MKKQIKAVMFFQDWGTYWASTLVSINNKTYNDLGDMLDKKADKDWHEAIKYRFELTDEMEKLEKSHHFTIWTWPDGKRYSTLFLPEWRWTAHDYTILAHELIHAVSFTMWGMMDLIKENEAMAYQHTYLMEAILQRLEKHKKTSILH